ncbi:unnamed protein product, partial [Dibothriocephalus latus]
MVHSSLKPNHEAINCRSRKACGVARCSMRHHPLLHRQEVRTDRFPMKADAEPRSDTAHCHSTYRPEQVVALGVLLVKVFGPRGSVTTYAFLDNGSDTTLIDEKLLNQLGLCGYRAALSVSTVVQTAEVKSEVVLEHRYAGQEDPNAVRTPLGWVLMGPISRQGRSN